MYLIELQETDTGKLLNKEYYSETKEQTLAERAVIIFASHYPESKVDYISMDADGNYVFRIKTKIYTKAFYVTVYFRLLTKIHG